jgi:hypothetical protein
MQVQNIEKDHTSLCETQEKKTTEKDHTSFCLMLQWLKISSINGVRLEVMEVIVYRAAMFLIASFLHIRMKKWDPS